MSLYLFLKITHMAAVVVFLGNIIIGLFWMSRAYDTKDPAMISFVAKTVIKSDRWFTLPSIVVIVAGGIWMAILARLPILRTGWILWSIILFSVSGLCFSFRVSPLQNKLFAIASKATAKKIFSWEDFKVVYLEWELWGLISIGAPVLSMILMRYYRSEINYDAENYLETLLVNEADLLSTVGRSDLGLELYQRFCNRAKEIPCSPSALSNIEVLKSKISKVEVQDL